MSVNTAAFSVSLGVGFSPAGEVLAAGLPLLFYNLRLYPVLRVTVETKTNKR